MHDYMPLPLCIQSKHAIHNKKLLKRTNAHKFVHPYRSKPRYAIHNKPHAREIIIPMNHISDFALRPLDCNFRHTSQKDCNQITIFFISKSPVFNTIYPVFTVHRPDFTQEHRHPTPKITQYPRKYSIFPQALPGDCKK